MKILNIEICDFIYLGHTSLENLEIKTSSFISKEMEKKMIEILLLIKTLKKVKFELSEINNDDISKIKGENTSLKKLNITWKNENSDCILYNLQSKFPNLSNLKINEDTKNLFNPTINIEIIENLNCKVNKLKLYLKNRNTKIFCGSFENLAKIKIFNINKQINLEKSLPIFNYKCPVIFNSLLSFEFTDYTEEGINIETLNNLYNNINKMPYLLYFSIDCVVKELKKDLYIKFIQKMTSLKLKELHIIIKINKYIDNWEYSKKEIRKICPIINCNHFFIQRY